MKNFTSLFLFIIMFVSTFAQTPQKIYDESIDAVQQINTAVSQAATDNKYVVCQVGGNWCPWCIRFNNLIKQDSTINQVVNENFVYIHVNYSQANKNPKAMQMLGNPARFGFPVLVILDEKGNVIHIQNSSYLEEGQGYNAKNVLEFFQQWTPTAVHTLK